MVQHFDHECLCQVYKTGLNLVLLQSTVLREMVDATAHMV